jgi:hypothetical protein
MALPFFIASIALVRHSRELSFYACGCVGVCREQLWNEGYAPLATMRPFVMLAPLAGIASALVAPVRGLRVFCLLTAAFGAIAYAASRRHAWDAEHPIAYRDEPACQPLDSWPEPIITVSAAGATIDDDSRVEYILSLKRSVWIAMHPRRSFDATAYVATDTDPSDTIARLRRAGYNARVLFRTQRPQFRTRTLGALERTPVYCAR